MGKLFFPDPFINYFFRGSFSPSFTQKKVSFNGWFTPSFNHFYTKCVEWKAFNHGFLRQWTSLFKIAFLLHVTHWNESTFPRIHSLTTFVMEVFLHHSSKRKKASLSGWFTPSNALMNYFLGEAFLHHLPPRKLPSMDGYPLRSAPKEKLFSNAVFHL